MMTLSLLSPLMMIIDEDRDDDDRRGLHNALEHISMFMPRQHTLVADTAVYEINCRARSRETIKG